MVTENDQRYGAARGRTRVWKWVTLCVVAVVVLVGGTWFAALQFQSPTQREAAAGPPSPQPVLAPVRKGDLTDRITVNGRAVGEARQTIFFSAEGGQTKLVTAWGVGIEIGKTLLPGSLLLWENDRPLFVLEGAFGAYRDLRIGDEGPDVRQLQLALLSLGRPVSVDGYFGPITLEALSTLYRENGLELQRVRAAPTDRQNAQSGTEPTPVIYEYVLPQSEVVFIPSLGDGTRLEAIPSVGTVLNGETAQVSVSRLNAGISAEVPGTVAASLSIRLPAKFTFENTEVHLVTSSIRAVQDDEGSEEDGEVTSASVIEFEPTDGVLPQGIPIEQDILVEISRVEPVKNALIAPKRAIFAAPDGSTHVLRQDKSGDFTEVDVTELLCVSGECAVQSRYLQEGDQLRVDTP